MTGLTSDWVLAVDRAETMRLFVYWDPTDGMEYLGSLSGQDFVLAGRFDRGNPFSIGCAGGGPVQVILSGRVWGRFSDDGRSISAEQAGRAFEIRGGNRRFAKSPARRSPWVRATYPCFDRVSGTLTT